MIARIALLALALTACGNAGIDDGLECGDWTTEVDGICVGDEPIEPDPVTMESLLDAMEPCDAPETGDGRLDLDAGCADDVCAGGFVGTINAAMGEEARCIQPYPGVAEYLECTWSNGAVGGVYDLDGDGVPGEDALVLLVIVEDDFDGTTADGFGIGDRVSCLVDSLGAPDELSFVQTKQGWFATTADWYASGVSMADGLSASEEPDGTFDRITLTPAEDPET